MDGSSRAKQSPSPKLRSGIIQCSNPNGGNGQKIKVELSESIYPITNNQSFLRKGNISRKLDLPDKEPRTKAKDEEDVSLECKKKNWRFSRGRKQA